MYLEALLLIYEPSNADKEVLEAIIKARTALALYDKYRYSREH